MPRRKGGAAQEMITGGAPPYPLYLPLHVPVRQQGIKRKPYAPRAKRPLTQRHLAVLGALTSEPQGAAALDRLLDLPIGAANQVLFVLQARGLATRVGLRKGWIAAQNDKG
jgi:hypothetical protein